MPHLLDALDPDRRRAVESVRQAAARLWAAPTHRHAVAHGPDHADRVAALLDGLTDGMMARGEHALAAEEIHILLTAVYLHAVGLQDEQSEPDPAARWMHYPELGAEMIYRALEPSSQAADLGLPTDPTLVEMIALAVRGHGQTDYSASAYDDFFIGQARVRPRLLTALLRMACGLDLDSRRVDVELLRLMIVAPEEALDWWLHYYVSGVRVEREYVQIAYRIPEGAPDYERLLPELVEQRVRADFAALRDTFRRYDVRLDIAPPTAVRPLRAVRPMPAGVWAAAQARLARLRGQGPPEPPLSPLVATVRGLLTTMGYDCQPASPASGQLTVFLCQPRGGGLRAPLIVGCKHGPAEVADVQAVAGRFGPSCQQGYVVAETRVLDSAQEAARQNGRVRVFTLAGFYGELLDFRAYVERLVDGYTGSELARYYVDLGCVRYAYDDQGRVVSEDRYKPLDGYIDAWLKAGSERSHISILGDYGTGKTSFCKQYAAKQGRRWLADPDRERIPVLINLRDYAKTLKVESLVTDALVNQYGIQGATFEAFSRYNADGKLLVLFDGFDEMAERTGARTAVANFWELARVVVPGSKVILTCRTPYFRTHREAESLLHGRLPDEPPASISQPPTATSDYIDLSARPEFEIVHLQPFSDEDIQAVLRARFPHRWQEHWQRVQRVYNLPDLARRPVLLDMIARTLADFQEGETINAARLYQLYTAQWLAREAGRGRTLLSEADRRLFAEGLAMDMLGTGELAIHYSRIPERVRQHFRLERAEEIDHFEADVRTCHFLNRDAAGNYAFVHKSFMEFFAANRLHGLMIQERATADGPVRINEEVRRFLTDLFALQPKEEPGPPGAPPPGFVWVPPGEFVLGGEGGLAVQIARLPQGFFAARAPVTNAEFARFVQAGGYRERKYWTSEGWRWRREENWTQPRLWHDRLFNDPAQPVVGISWYEAAAYCAWLSEEGADGRPPLPDGWSVRLPTEEEWEKAARGYDGREYPWGSEWAAGRCNTAEAGIERPVPAGRFSPAGDGPYGLQDAAGNVWEWTASAWEPGSAARVVRGGSWFNDQRIARCAARDGGYPTSWWLNLGFRVVVSPVSPRSAL